MYQKVAGEQSIGGVRLADEDVRAVISLWAAQQGHDQHASVVDVAEGLDISAEEVHALLEEVRAHRLTAEQGLAQERARFTEEQRHLAEEQARLWRAENGLAEYHVKRSDLHQQRLNIRTRWVPRHSLKTPLHQPLVGQSMKADTPPFFSPATGPTGRTFARLLAGLIASGIGLLLLWNFVSIIFHLLSP